MTVSELIAELNLLRFQVGEDSDVRIAVGDAVLYHGSIEVEVEYGMEGNPHVIVLHIEEYPQIVSIVS